MSNQRVQFSTRMGVIATTVGSAVGLGNIWRFPYEAGVHGGGAFLLIYIFFILLIGIPVVCSEFIMGRGTRRNIFGAFQLLAGNNRWAWVGYMGILCSTLILSFYSVVAGWTVEYFFQSLKMLFGADRPPVGELHTIFKDFSTGLRPVVWTLVFLTANALVLLRGVKRGIEKVSNILMPVLFILLVVFCINSLLMDGAADGLRFLFYPDFSKVNSSMMIGALGQAFFSLSLGLGTMMIYASYFSDRTPLIKSASTTAALDTLVALLAGIMIFPAVFTFGVAPAAGPELVFEVLPSVFRMMPFGDIWSLMFFFLLMVASLTSTISMSELCVAFFTEQFNMSRRCAVLINTATTMILGTLCALSFGLLSDIQLCGKTIFNLFDYLSSNIMLPLGGMAIAFFVGWKVSPAIVNAQLGNAPGWLKKSIMVSLRYIAPAGIGLVFLSGLQLW